MASYKEGEREEALRGLYASQEGPRNTLECVEEGIETLTGELERAAEEWQEEADKALERALELLGPRIQKKFLAVYNEDAPAPISADRVLDTLPDLRGHLESLREDLSSIREAVEVYTRANEDWYKFPTVGRKKA